MKNMKKWVVLLVCVLALGSMTGCGNRDNSVDGADNGTTNTMDSTDKTNTTDNADTPDKGDGVMDEAVRDVTDGINDVTDDLTDGDVRSEQTR